MFRRRKPTWISKRCCEIFKKLNDKGLNVIRADINQLRNAYGICSHYLSRTSIDCKNLQTSLRIKYGFESLPDNMLSASALEAIILAMFSMEYTNNIQTTTMFEIDNSPVLARVMTNWFSLLENRFYLYRN